MNNKSTNQKSKAKPAKTKPASRTELEAWVKEYSLSAGPAADLFLAVLQKLFGARLLKPSSRELLLELLKILENLSADPITISCAMLHVAEQAGGELDGIVDTLPAELQQQLEEL